MTKAFAGLTALAAFATTPSAAQQEHLHAWSANPEDGFARSDPLVYDGAAGQLSVPSPWVAEAGIDIDGALDEAAWANAPLLTGFTQFDPVEGAPATQRTEARILLTDNAVYFGVKAYDDMPGGARATLGDRDSFARSDDYVRIVLDTFDDRRRGYVVMANPYGVQQDGLWVVGGGGRRRFGPPIDWNPDFVWDSKGRMFDWGYSVEIRLPLKSIRFPDAPMQNWGLQIERRIARNGYSESWAPVTANTSNQMEQFGSLTGLENMDPGLFLELNPVQTVTSQGTFDDDGTLERRPVTGDFGMNVAYGITSNLTLDGTFNPDFSQVESDAGQIEVNERFALFLPEKRPFFLKGAEVFRLPQRLVHTRSIVNPVGGAKLTGKIGSYTFGYLGAVDEVGDPAGEDGDAHPVVNIVRVRRDVGDNSTAGLVYTDRNYGSDRYNRVAGLDGRFEITPRFTLTVLAAASRTSEGGPDPDVAGGSIASARLERSGRNFQFNAAIQDAGGDFVAGSGFIRRTGVAQVDSRVSYNFRGRPGDAVERWGPSLEVEGLWDHEDFWRGQGLKEARVQVGGSVSFRGNIAMWANYGRRYFKFGHDEYAGLVFAGPGGSVVPFRPDQSRFQGLQSAAFFTWINAFDQVRGNIRATWSETPLFEFVTDTPADVANSWSGEASLDFFPTTRTRGEIGVRHTTLRRKRDGSLYSQATIPRVRLQYQFTRALFLRTIAEYGSQRRLPLLTPDEGAPLSYCSDVGDCSELEGAESNDFSVEALLGYEPTPGTVFFLGYTRLMEDMAPFRFRDVRAEADGVFVKMSYRFRG